MKIYSLGQLSPEEKSDILEKHRTLYDGYRTMQPKVSNTQPLYTQDFAADKNGITVSNKGVVKKYTNVGINEQVNEKEMCSECGGGMYEGECMECGWKGDMGEQTKQVEDLKHVEDLHGKFDYVEGEMGEIDASSLIKGKKYKFKHPEFSDELEYEDEYESPEKMDKIYKFRGKDFHAMPKGSVERFIDDLDEEIDETEQGNPYYDEKPAYDFISGGPGKAFREQWDEEDYMTSAFDDEDITGIEDDDVDLDNPEDSPIDFVDDETEMSLGDEDVEEMGWEEIDSDIRESFVNQKNLVLEMMNRMKPF